MTGPGGRANPRMPSVLARGDAGASLWSRAGKIAVCLAGVVVLGGCSGLNPDSATATPTRSPTELIAERLPDFDELPDNFVLQGEEELTIHEYAASWPDEQAGNLIPLLRDWGFELAVRRVFATNPALTASETGVLDWLIADGVNYQSTEAAVDASETSLSMVMQREGFDLQLVETDPIGDFTLAAVGTFTVKDETFDGEPVPGYRRTWNVALVWIVDGPLVVSYQGAATGGEPLADVLEIAKAVSARSRDRALAVGDAQANAVAVSFDGIECLTA